MATHLEIYDRVRAGEFLNKIAIAAAVTIVDRLEDREK